MENVTELWILSQKQLNFDFRMRKIYVFFYLKFLKFSTETINFRALSEFLVFLEFPALRLKRELAVLFRR